MVIKIYYKEYKMFDIDFYQTKDETKADSWCSDICCCECVSGISYFLKDKLNDKNFNLDEFINDSEVIEEIRGWLWERHSNNMCSLDLSQKRHYHEFKPELDNIVKTYCDKYGFSINVD